MRFLLPAFLPALLFIPSYPLVLPSIHPSIPSFLPPRSVVMVAVLLLLKFLREKRHRISSVKLFPWEPAQSREGRNVCAQSPVSALLYTRLILTSTVWFHGLPSWIIACTRHVLIVQTSTNSSIGCWNFFCSPLALKLKSHRVSKKKLTWSRPDKGPHVSVHAASIFKPK